MSQDDGKKQMQMIGLIALVVLAVGAVGVMFMQQNAATKEQVVGDIGGGGRNSEKGGAPAATGQPGPTGETLPGQESFETPAGK